MLRTITAGFAFMALTADAAAACPAGYGACMVAGGTTICATGTSGGPHVYCDLKNGPGGTTAGRLTAKTEIVAGGTLYFTIWGNDDHNNKFCCATYPVLDGTGTRRFLRVTGSQLKDTIDMCPSGGYRH